AVYQAMGHGALDAVDTPTFGLQGEIAATSLFLNKIELIGKLMSKPIGPRGPEDAEISLPEAALAAPPEPTLEPLIVLGASTGGPHALAEVLSSLPATLESGIIIVQHIGS